MSLKRTWRAREETEGGGGGMDAGGADRWIDRLPMRALLRGLRRGYASRRRGDGEKGGDLGLGVR